MTFFSAFRWYNKSISRDKAEKLLLDTVSLYIVLLFFSHAVVYVNA